MTTPEAVKKAGVWGDWMGGCMNGWMDGWERGTEGMNLSLCKAEISGSEEPWTKQASTEGLPHPVDGGYHHLTDQESV